MTREQAIQFIRYHGVVLESGRGNEPSLAEWIAGGDIRGSWWSHPAGQHIYDITRAVRDSRAILVCGLAAGRVTYVHRRLWPYFVRLAERFPPRALDQICEVHSPAGRHYRQDVPFPAWVPREVVKGAKSISVAEATDEIELWLDRYRAA